MNQGMNQGMNQPTFARGTTLGIVLVGALAFAVVLYWLGTGGGQTNNGGGHAGGRGLNGYAGLAAMLQADGVTMNRARSKDALKSTGLVILTPPADAKGDDIAAIINDRRFVGPTMVIAPKWVAIPDKSNPKMRRGWTRLGGTNPPEWKNYHDDLSVHLSKVPAGGWRGSGEFAERRGTLPDDRQVQSGEGPGLESLIETSDGRTLAGYVVADGNNAVLARWIGLAPRAGEDDENIADNDDEGAFPVVLVFEPDLMNNWGLATRETGLMARRLVFAASGVDRPGKVTFDLTLNGLGASRNLLTLAFEPPFLAATLCFAMALFAAGWRGFNRFGPARQTAREIPLGKTVLVRNTAGLIRRAGRMRLVAGPYADASRERLVLALGLPRGRAAAEIEAAIDRMQERQDTAAPRYSQLAAQLRAARSSADVVQRAAALQRVEKDLTA